jgi:hypothetical protein
VEAFRNSRRDCADTRIVRCRVRTRRNRPEHRRRQLRERTRRGQLLERVRDASHRRAHVVRTADRTSGDMFRGVRAMRAETAVGFERRSDPAPVRQRAVQRHRRQGCRRCQRNCGRKGRQTGQPRGNARELEARLIRHGTQAVRARHPQAVPEGIGAAGGLISLRIRLSRYTSCWRRSGESGAREPGTWSAGRMSP